MPDLRGGPFDGERVTEMGLYCYVTGYAGRSTPTAVPVVRIHRVSPRQIIGVTEQHVYRRQESGGECWYAWLMELEHDAA